MLLPILVAVVMVLLAVIAFMVGRNYGSTTQPATPSTPANTTTDAATAEQTAEAPAPRPDMAQPITDKTTLDLIKTLPKREEGDPLTLGPVDAPVVMIIWEDYACPMCTKFKTDSFDTVRKYADEGKIRIEWRDMAIFAQNYHSDLAAIGGRAAANQGKFWEFNTAAFASAGAGNHPTYDEASVLEIAKQAGVPDLEKFKKDFADPELAKKVNDDTAFAQSIGIGGTPFFIIGDAAVSGAYPTEYFVNTIEDRIANLK
ncbi:hypothetical protein BM477_01180 [Boudabousia marimammalium]|uniref:Thioredoxin-like fold domain-containing protein n=1 Tax=Boudabousia marimammalium TaxID=156892 RepID=A0A1Q5PSX1_9ACTO|nr:hypothetical protein BM477_01180 [Boudabousia marimammalium]